MTISAIILAAGESKRMGQPKLLLPWENTTVLGKVIETIQHAGIEDILVVTGGARDEVEKIIANYKLQVVYNEIFEHEEMLTSIQLGLQAQKTDSEATLICLGDQPQIEERIVRNICDSFLKTKSPLVVPSYQMKRGHPWLVARPLSDELLKMKSPRTPRDFLKKHARKIHYVNVDTPSVIQDLDTPEDYLKYKS